MGGRCFTLSKERRLNTDYSKTVVDPIRQVVPCSTLRGFTEGYGDRDEDVLLPAVMYTSVVSRYACIARAWRPSLPFTTTTPHDDFARTILYNLRPTDDVQDLARRLPDRMTKLTGGDRRRHTCVVGTIKPVFTSFALVGLMEVSVEVHGDRVKQRLETGRETLRAVACHRDMPRPRCSESTVHDTGGLAVKTPRYGSTQSITASRANRSIRLDRKTLAPACQILPTNHAVRTQDAPVRASPEA
ncbi:hypothetical protein EW146_g5388 [Bondarzewia mesenterica]|uniref:Uncharacterized protein n=1 Tax=Bondarzewia mesenterica TaxID=1095465 RepID=A0A4S4LTI1_9AGAM|nr:hypothetical protein EW146_g5388 [Bondarzewia mesenterica]